jgi:aspartyl-tRNA(Asn)/glutamyl-tRNA(Gln) amidotransferase subunit C
MARVTVDTVAHVAQLARLSLTPEERQIFARQLDEVLAFAESIQALDTRDVEPMSHAVTFEALREDVPAPELPREKALAAAPDADGGLYRVPRVIGG